MTAGRRWIDRPMTEADIPAVRAMEMDACIHPVHAWSEDNYRSSMRAGYWVRVRCDAETSAVAAVLVMMDGVEEMHLLNIAVARQWHGSGLAQELMDVLYDLCRQRAAPTLWLEVRPSNLRAKALYERQGFESVGIRKNYYPAPQGREDALVMKRMIPTQTEAAHAVE